MKKGKGIREIKNKAKGFKIASVWVINFASPRGVRNAQYIPLLNYKKGISRKMFFIKNSLYFYLKNVASNVVFSFQ